jgi:hypothetical protein
MLLHYTARWTIELQKRLRVSDLVRGDECFFTPVWDRPIHFNSCDGHHHLFIEETDQRFAEFSPRRAKDPWILSIEWMRRGELRQCIRDLDFKPEGSVLFQDGNRTYQAPDHIFII